MLPLPAPVAVKVAAVIAETVAEAVVAVVKVAVANAENADKRNLIFEKATVKWSLFLCFKGLSLTLLNGLLLIYL